MKILIASDGSECSDAAIIDLRRAGLPAAAEALVFSVAQISPQVEMVPSGVEMAGPGMIFPQQWESKELIDHQLKQAQSFAAEAAGRLRLDFPGWHINTESWADAAWPAIVRQAHAWNPDLIVVGSHGRSGLNRLVIGSVSERVLHHVKCSVRISRHHLHLPERAIRVLVGVDGSDNARTAVQAVAARNWPPGTEARAVGVLDARIPIAAATTLEGCIPSAMEDEYRRRMSEAVHEAAEVLAKPGLVASHQVLFGEPGKVLLEEAEKWAADSVFVGARGLNILERFLLGSVSTAVASHARCSVEVVRLIDRQITL